MARPRMPLSRDSLSDDSFKQAMLDEHPGAMSLMDPEAFEASRQKILRQAERVGELWVFAYGSLIWNPIIDVAEIRPATLHGYSRRFCVWAVIGRGTPDCPGLWLGLDEGGACSGVALRVERGSWDEETLILWRREMISGVYRPEWLMLKTEQGPLPCCAFVANPDHERYVTEISDADTITAIARGCGSLGTCRDYLFTLDERLAGHGFRDPYIQRLAQDVRAVAEQSAHDPAHQT